ncbi:UreD-domain-containing protein [Crucibulum laeve]|uniref:UreD-domain-containing protein n=1 Tax=Crucibulum laeve TaxID=68775 RepID=A0A5C3LXI8_9AGAR|nr:UreD-domain-containing protein [Crucibulum laeve]
MSSKSLNDRDSGQDILSLPSSSGEGMGTQGFLASPIEKIHAGGGRICVASHGQKAVFSELSATYPLKLLSPRIAQDGVAVVYILSYGGGLVSGDRVDLSVDVQLGANLVLLSQGSTKVFKSRPGQRLASVKSRHDFSNTDASMSPLTRQNMLFTVKAHSALFLLPDPVTCFRDASYNQVQRFELFEDASLVVLDWFTSGRKSLGEEWVFSRYYSINEIFVDGKRIAKDVTLLDDKLINAKLPPRTLGDRLAPYSCYAMVLLYGPKLQETIGHITAEYGQISVFKARSPADLIWSLSPINSAGAVVRVAGRETETVKLWLQKALRGIEHVVGTDVYQRAFV